MKIKTLPAYLLCLSFMLFSVMSFAQQQPNNIAMWLRSMKTTEPFAVNNIFSSAVYNTPLPVENASIFEIDKNALASLIANQPQIIELELPLANNQSIKLTMARVEVTAPEFTVGTKGESEEIVPYSNGIHYRGIITDDENSVAAFSFFNNEVIGFYSSSQGNFNLGKLESNETKYILYNTNQLPADMAPGCYTEEVESPTPNEPLEPGDRAVGCKVVKAYLECDYKLYSDKGHNDTTVTNYVIALFSQVTALYANENIDMQISQIKVWTSTDPYASLTTTSAVLSAYRTTLGSGFNGDIAHFLTTRNLGGGIAYINVLCNKSYAFGLSMIYNSYSNVPNYSWSVEVVTHEMGHNLGSPHTQSCSWVGGALDNCYTVEGSCSPGPAPVNGGTIMSYCHLTSYGINFNNGFGQQPGDLIRSKVTNASCLATSGIAPSGLASGSITSSSVSVSWVAVAGATQYTVEYKLSTSPTWISGGSTGATSLTLSGLTANSSYQWHVKTSCSAYSATATFTTSTGVSCSIASSLTTSAITFNSATLSWSAVSGAASYTPEYKLSTSSTWIPLTTVTTTSTSLTGLASSSTYNWHVKANCSAFSSAISFTTSASSSPPVITQQPQSITVAAGSAASFSVTATGTPPLTYQWKKGTTNISGATNSTYTIPSTATGDAGTFSVIVSNGTGSATSNNATLTVTTGSSTVTLNPFGDAYVMDGSANSNFGGSTEIISKKYSGNGYKREIYIRFNISSFPISVTNAKLRLYGALLNNQDASATVEVHNVSNVTWLENTITWNNKPAADAASLGSKVISGTTKAYYDWDITSYISSAKNSGATYISLKLISITNTEGNYATFNSKEALTNKPQLVVTTNGTGGIIASSSVASLNNSQLYPNPVSNQLHVVINNWNENLNTKIEIYSVSGVLINSYAANQADNTIETGQLPKDIYILKIVSEEQNPEVLRFVKD